jgi:ABC-2 family transporter
VIDVPRPVRTLAWLEGVRLLRHPAFLSGLAIASLGIASFVRSAVTDPTSTWHEDGWPAAVGFLLLAIFSMVAANLAALRDRRSGTVDQHTSLPVDRSAVISAQIVATSIPAVVAALLLGAVVVYAASREQLPGLEVVHVLEFAALFVMLGTLGIALATWLPNPFVTPVLAWGLFLLQPGARSWHVVLPLSFTTSVGLTAWHLVELLGLTLVFAALALRKWTDRGSVLVAGAAGGVITVVATLVMIPGACPSIGPCAW